MEDQNIESLEDKIDQINASLGLLQHNFKKSEDEETKEKEKTTVAKSPEGFKAKNHKMLSELENEGKPMNSESKDAEVKRLKTRKRKLEAAVAKKHKETEDIVKSDTEQEALTKKTKMGLHRRSNSLQNTTKSMKIGEEEKQASVGEFLIPKMRSKAMKAKPKESKMKALNIQNLASDHKKRQRKNRDKIDGNIKDLENKFGQLDLDSDTFSKQDLAGDWSICRPRTNSTMDEDSMSNKSFGSDKAISWSFRNNVKLEWNHTFHQKWLEKQTKLDGFTCPSCKIAMTDDEIKAVKEGKQLQSKFDVSRRHSC